MDVRSDLGDRDSTEHVTADGESGSFSSGKSGGKTHRFHLINYKLGREGGNRRSG